MAFLLAEEHDVSAEAKKAIERFFKASMQQEKAEQAYSQKKRRRNKPVNSW